MTTAGCSRFLRTFAKASRPNSTSATEGLPLPRGGFLADITVTPDFACGLLCQNARMSPTVLIVDDHAGFGLFATALLRAEGYTVVGEAGDGAGALREARRLQPGLVLLDIQLPDIDGFEVARQLAADRPPLRVVLTSSRDASDYRRRLAHSNALGFIPKAQLSAAFLGALLGGS